jgi:hypothetical protein
MWIKPGTRVTCYENPDADMPTFRKGGCVKAADGIAKAARLAGRCVTMRASRGMGCINPAKMPKGTVKQRRDNTDFTEYAEGGEAKSKVNEAGNYTKPGMRKSHI